MFQVSGSLAEEKPKEKKIESWQRSVGGFSTKNSLKSLVKKKDTSKIIKSHGCTLVESTDFLPLNSSGTTTKTPTVSTNVSNINSTNTISQSSVTTTANDVKDCTAEIVPKANGTGSSISALGMLGGYSDSESDSS